MIIEAKGKWNVVVKAGVGQNDSLVMDGLHIFGGQYGYRVSHCTMHFCHDIWYD